jgi:AraC-like DNA-binding protein
VALVFLVWACDGSSVQLVIVAAKGPMSVQSGLLMNVPNPSRERSQVAPNGRWMDRRIETAIEIMREGLHRNLPMQDLASEVHLSRWHFIRLFKAETSFSPKQYVLNLKMKQAEQLLNESFLSVKEIAASLGFEDRSQFSREFKKICGCAPTAFRARRGTSTVY